MASTNVDSPVELWKSVPGYEGFYLISNHGNVKSESRLLPSGNGGLRRLYERILKPNINKGGYYYVGLHRDSKAFYVSVHQLVARAFIGPQPDGIFVNHIDGNKLNNALSNLEYVTPAENNQHAVRMGLVPASNTSYKLTEDQVREIRRRAAEGVRASVLARQYKIDPENIRRAIRRHSFKWVE